MALPINIIDHIIPPVYSTKTTYTYYIDDSNYRNDSTITMQDIHDSINYWSTNNDIKFIHTNNKSADITIQFAEHSKNTMGMNGCIYDKCAIIIYQGSLDCNNEYHTYTKQIFDIIIKHEIGHAIGIKHTNIMGNLMHGYDSTSNYNPRDLSIPLVDPFFVEFQTEQDIITNNNITIDYTGYLYPIRDTDRINIINNMNIPNTLKEEINCFRTVHDIQTYLNVSSFVDSWSLIMVILTNIIL